MRPGHVAGRGRLDPYRLAGDAVGAAWDPQRLAADIERVGARGLPYGELHTELAARIRHVMPVDAFCWHGLDPDTRLLTTANPVELMTGGSSRRRPR